MGKLYIYSYYFNSGFYCHLSGTVAGRSIIFSALEGLVM
ncbi:hypothetical protein DCCM_3906 [Desulfocucumis palustris]|uniref:Uncharacterized protein n=1 Tax=Desulfocucumis palustris TaxID=1898651 RepID=A0A2L2XKH4_9FIRM|nr:hypothetical protein DCCM_3906 [Desulfocucumis palustris]